MSTNTYTGVFHVHTDRCGAEHPLDDIVEAAKKNDIQFVAITDHGSLGDAMDEAEGWVDGVLLLRAEEVPAPDGHLLALETRELIGKVDGYAAAVESIRAQSGTSVSLHHQLGLIPHLPVPGPIPPGGCDMMEIWSFMDEFLARTSSRYVLQAITRPDKLIHGPHRSLFWKWDRVLEQRQMPVVGGVNVRPRKEPLLEWKVLFPYDVAFQTICTCIQIPELPSVSLRARDMVWNALRQGRSYIANRSVGPERGFSFEYQPKDGRRRLMGDDVAYSPGGKFFVSVPAEAEVVLRQNGQPLLWGTAKDTSFPASGPGNYRVEVYLGRRLWIVSNAIRLLDDEGVVQPTVSDVT